MMIEGESGSGGVIPRVWIACYLIDSYQIHIFCRKTALTEVWLPCLFWCEEESCGAMRLLVGYGTSTQGT